MKSNYLSFLQAFRLRAASDCPAGDSPRLFPIICLNDGVNRTTSKKQPAAFLKQADHAVNINYWLIHEKIKNDPQITKVQENGTATKENTTITTKIAETTRPEKIAKMPHEKENSEW